MEFGEQKNNNTGVEGSVEEQNQTPAIPEFNPAAFMADEEDLSINSTGAEYVPPVKTQEQINSEEADLLASQSGDGAGGDDKDLLSYEDDFISASNKPTSIEFKEEDHVQLAASLGVEIKTQEDLDAVRLKLNGPKSNQEDTNPNDYSRLGFNEEESKNIEQYDGVIEYLKTATPESIMEWQLKQNNPEKFKDNPEELQFQIENLKEAGLLKSQADLVKSQISSDVNDKKEELISSAQRRVDDASLTVDRELETALKSYKEGFHGLQVSPRDMVDLFKSVKDNSLFNEIESSQANVAEMALLWKNRELFYKASKRPSASDGTKSFMEELQNSKVKVQSGSDTLLSPKSFNPVAFLEGDHSIQ